MCFASFEVIDNTIFNENELQKVLKYSAHCHRLYDDRLFPDDTKKFHLQEKGRS